MTYGIKKPKEKKENSFIEKKNNRIDKIIAYEEGRLNDEETIKLFQDLEDTGLAYSLQGHYGRTATSLIGAGLIKPNMKIHSKEEIRRLKQTNEIEKAFN